MRACRVPSLVLVLGLVLAGMARAEEALRIYGPGGPAPAMKDAAGAFAAAQGSEVEVAAGPTPQWLDRAKQDADLIYSGSENMMTGFIRLMPEQIVPESVQPLYLRPSSILVRPGNPLGIGGLKDLAAPDRKVLVVEGAGQVGLWEDMAGRRGDIGMVRALRRNIVAFPSTTAEALRLWRDRPEIEAWIVWNIWEAAAPELADTVAVEPEHVIWRPASIALTRRGQAKPAAARFVTYLLSPEGAAHFARYGWKTGG